MTRRYRPLAQWTSMTPSLRCHFIGFSIASGRWTTWRPTSRWALNAWRKTA